MNVHSKYSPKFPLFLLYEMQIYNHCILYLLKLPANYTCFEVSVNHQIPSEKKLCTLLFCKRIIPSKI